MNNKEFIAELSRRTGYKIADTQSMVRHLIDAMSDVFQEGDIVSVSDFGTFEVKKKMERILVNPGTRQRMLVPPKLVLGFKPNAAWKGKLKSSSRSSDDSKKGGNV